MGGGASIEVDPTALRHEYEALAAKNVGDQELLDQMKRLIFSTPKANNEDAGSSQEGAAESLARRGSASRRPNSHNSRLSYSSSTHSSQQRRLSVSRRPSVDSDRPLSAPPTKLPVPKQRPRSSLGEGKDDGGKPAKTRRRSFVGQTIASTQDDSVGPAAGLTATAAGDVPAQVEPAQELEKMQIDSWESVSQQPSCPLCHMVFSTEGKRDQHMKYSPAHAPPAEGSAPQQAEDPVIDSSITIYSGTKFFWRTRLNVELFVRQHKKADAVQILVFDTSANSEVGQVWVSWTGVVAKLDQREMKNDMQAATGAFDILGLKPSPDDVAAEATRKAVVSFIMKRIQVDEITEACAETESPKSYKISLMKMATDDDTNLIVDQPGGVDPTFSRALMKRASIQEINEVMTSLRKSLGDVSQDAKAAVASLTVAQGAVQQMEVARRASIQAS